MAIRLRTVLAAAMSAALIAAPALAETASPVCAGTNLIDKAKAETPEKYAAFVADAEKVPNAEGLLWRIDAKGAPASYLFGTMHTTDRALTDLAAPVREAIDAAKSVAVEIVGADSPAAQAEMTAFISQHGIDPEGGGLTGLTEEQTAEVKRRLAEAGLPGENAPMLKPWFLAVTLEMSACELKKMGEGELTVDGVIEKLGRDKGAKVVGLETIREQLEAISKISEATARRMVRDSVAKRTASDDMQATTLALYKARHVGWYYAMKPDTFEGALDLSAYKDFLEDIVDRRNRLMLERATPLIEAGGAVIAVGALHLPGEKGLVELMRKQGYAVTKVW